MLYGNATFEDEHCLGKTFDWLKQNGSGIKDDGIRHKTNCNFSYTCGPDQNGVDTCLSVNRENCTRNKNFTCTVDKTSPVSIQTRMGYWGIPVGTACQPSKNHFLWNHISVKVFFPVPSNI